jgi:type IV pilus assembly protein PilV
MSKANCSREKLRAAASGFTLIEVMVALIVTAIGLLGIAKMQALAYASTSTASVRSLAAIQAASLAATMHANRAYWATGLAPVAVTITGTSISDATLNGAAAAVNYCKVGGAGVPCTPDTLAAFDLHTWANALNAMLPTSIPITVITCPISAPINCTIQISWTEKTVAINTNGAGAAMAAPTYTLYVEP